MLTVKESAERLGVTPERVRNMIYDGVLPAEKFGSNWAIPEEAIKNRLEAKPRRGRPRKSSTKEEVQYFVIPFEHHLYEECEKTFSQGYDAKTILAAEDEAEKAFYIVLWDFFLQQRQRKLIEEGVH